MFAIRPGRFLGPAICKKHRPISHKRLPGVKACLISEVQATVKAAPAVWKAGLQLAALMVGSVLGGATGVVLEEDVVRKGRGGMFSGIYGLLIGAPLGAAILSVLLTFLIS